MKTVRKKQIRSLPATIKCPIGGEEWPATSFKSRLDTTSKKFTYRCITFQCPANHFFTLSKAFREGMFTRHQANQIFDFANKEVAKYKKLPLGKVLPFLEEKLGESKKIAGW